MLNRHHHTGHLQSLGGHGRRGAPKMPGWPCCPPCPACWAMGESRQSPVPQRPTAHGQPMLDHTVAGLAQPSVPHLPCSWRMGPWWMGPVARAELSRVVGTPLLTDQLQALHCSTVGPVGRACSLPCQSIKGSLAQRCLVPAQPWEGVVSPTLAPLQLGQPTPVPAAPGAGPAQRWGQKTVSSCSTEHWVTGKEWVLREHFRSLLAPHGSEEMQSLGHALWPGLSQVAPARGQRLQLCGREGVTSQRPTHSC